MIYETPIMELIKFNTGDVVHTSPTESGMGGGSDGDGESGEF